MQTIAVVEQVSHAPLSHLPVIEISFAPPEESIPEPYSPFPSMNSTFCMKTNEDTYRPSLLSPPLSSPQHSELKKQAVPPKAKGLDQDTFQSLLEASREKSIIASRRKSVDLRKEVALKAHKNKQLERRALFLSKINAPPSPTATSLPKTPPESPAVFHFSLPSPGLVSPIALFESLNLGDPDSHGHGANREIRIEQVDFRAQSRIESLKQQLLSDPVKAHKRTGSIPSLQQITERYGSQAVANSHISISTPSARTPIPLPAFLNARREASNNRPDSKPLPALRTSRLNFPMRRSPPPDYKPLPAIPIIVTPPPENAEESSLKSSLQATAFTQITTSSNTLLPAQSTAGVKQRTAESRAVRSRDMLTTLRRRTAACELPAEASAAALAKIAAGCSIDITCGDRKNRRNSAPAELPRKNRIGFTHPVLSLPGSF